MRTRSLLLLAVLTAVTVAAAGWSVAVRSRTAPVVEGPLVPGLAARVNDAARLEIVGQGSRVTIVRTAGGWGVEQKDGYRADPDMVKALVLAVANARALEPRTAQPDLYPRLRVEDPAAPGAASTGVTLRATDGTPLAALVVGKPAAAPGTLYARRAGEGPSWLVKADLAVETDPLRWIDAALPRVPRDAVASVEIRQPDGRAVVIQRDAPDKPFAASVPAIPALIDETVDAMAQLVPQDVAKAGPAPDAVVTTVRRFDGTAVVLRTVRRDGQAWVMFEDKPGWRFRVFDVPGRALTRTPGDFAEGKS
ncbi:DUF4340 domain-containing protein [Azospirillum sp. TSO22-1]|uniref:DUF4340 domain-containing protein n=1 Tax=Azospirillum sp. TSO22-1 TaxID=716789 RepID=UPI000D61DFE1|nr:DUF4340 domain-containing protein [Azospirillum sp. TSO22-1]PWC45694.1 hypothetical protein TSO221_16105 [Azospirillum sp. TSO22-1]